MPSPLAVLVIDDQHQLAEVLAERLGLDGFEATVATTAAEALGACERRSYDVAFVDLRLPDTSGIVAAAELKRRTPGLRVILMTGLATSVDDPEMAWNQVDGVLPKPWTAAELDTILRTIGRRE